jgi:hypothetical protein
MSGRVRLGLGLLLILVGALWMLQGLGVVSGSAMTGVTLWAVIGPVVALAGLWVAFASRGPRD